jgi:very-short-patch-repair endonuclease
MRFESNLWQKNDPMPSDSKSSERARRLRKSQTEAEGLLWSLLRSKQLCGLKFRLQHPIGPFFADFACQSHSIAVELDGEYHDHVQENDLKRARVLESEGWRVIRFTNDDVLEDAEAVCRSIASQIGLPYTFRKRTANKSGMMSEKAPNNIRREDGDTRTCSPHPAAKAADLPRGEVNG